MDSSTTVARHAPPPPRRQGPRDAPRNAKRRGADATWSAAPTAAAHTTRAKVLTIMPPPPTPPAAAKEHKLPLEMEEPPPKSCRPLLRQRCLLAVPRRSGPPPASGCCRGMARALVLVWAATVSVSGLVLPRPAVRSWRAGVALGATQLEAFLEGRPGAARFYECVGEGCLTERPNPKPEAQELEEQTQISLLVDYLHSELMKLSPMADYEPEDAPLGDTMDDFIDEGRKMLSISQSRVCYGEDEQSVSDGVWEALGELFAEEEPNTGLLVALPEFVGDASTFVRDEVVKPLEMMGFGDRIETSSYRVAGGAPCPAFRLLVSPEPAPDNEGLPSNNDPMSLFQ